MKSDELEEQGLAKSANPQQLQNINSINNEQLQRETISAVCNLASIFERMNLADYLSNSRKFHRVMWINFLAGLARGLGMAIGMTLLFGIVIYVLSHMVGLPVVGKFIAKLVHLVNQEMKMRPK